MPLPDFLIIGAAKAGTTSIHYYLQQHPEIFMSPVKDTFFFNFNGNDPDFSGPDDNAWYKERAIINFADYQTLFAEAKANTVIGESCAGYLYDASAAKNIQQRLPDVRLIAILRDPVERAYSSFLQQVRDGYETTTDFAEALDMEAQRRDQNWRPIWHYENRGRYYQQIEAYLKLFDSTKLQILLYDDLQQDPVTMLKKIFTFIEVDASFEPDISLRHNRAGIPSSRFLFQKMMTPNLLKSVVKPFVPAGLRRKMRAAVTESDALLHRPELSDEIRARLIDGYKADILKLQSLINRDLSHWLS